MKINIISTQTGLEDLHDPWNALLRDSQENVVNLTHEWIATWWECFGDPHELHIVTATDDRGKLIGIAPLMLRESSYRSSRIMKICFLVNGISPSAAFIVRKDNAEEGVHAICSYLETYSRWDLIDLQKINMQGMVFSLLWKYLKNSDHLYGVKKNIESPYITVGADWKSFLRTRSSKFRKVLRNKLNRAEQAGDISLERILIADSRDPAIEEMFNISRRSWKRHSGTDIMSNPRCMKFYREICRRLGPKGMVTLWMLKKGDKRIAFEFHLTYEHVAYPIRADYDESYGDLSVGSLLEYNILMTLFELSHIREYNSCGHTYEYLMNWTDATRTHGNIEIFSKSLRPRALYVIEYNLLPFLRKLRVNKIMTIFRFW